MDSRLNTEGAESARGLDFFEELSTAQKATDPILDDPGVVSPNIVRGYN